MPPVLTPSSRHLHPHHRHLRHHAKPNPHGIRPFNAIHSPSNAPNSSSAATVAPDKDQPPPILSLLRTHAKAGRLHEASALFDALPDRSLVSWTILMSGYANHGPVAEALSLFRAMLVVPLPPDPVVFSVVLRACTTMGSLNLGRELHCSILKLNYIDDLFLANGLVTMYSTCGSLGYSELVFRRIQQPDLVSWTSVLSGCVKNGRNKEALRHFDEMARLGYELDAFVLSTGLKASANLGSLESGIQIHCCIIKMGFASSMFMKNCLLEFYGGIDELEMTRKLFHGMVEKDLVSWNTIISCHAQNLCSKEALILFRAMADEGLKGDSFTLGSALRAVTDSGALSHGKEIHGYMIRAGLESNCHAISALIDMYIKCLGCGTSDANSSTIPLELFRQCRFSGAELDEFIIASALKYCASQQDLQAGLSIHSCIQKHEMKSDPLVVSALIDMYSKCGVLDSAIWVFAGINDPDTAPWSAIISGHCQNGQFLEAMQLFRRMQLDGVIANEFTYTSAMQACIALNEVRIGREIHCNIIRRGYESNTSVANTLINLYTELRQPFEALKLCSSLSDNKIPWSLLIKTFARTGEHKEILKLFHKIQCSRGQLDHSSVRHVLNSCASPVLLNAGTQAHAYIIKRGLATETDTSNALVDMYSRCGATTDADNAFNQVLEKNSSTWTSIIAASVDHGQPSKALETFIQMTNKGKTPNCNTFVSILQACAQLGLVDEAFRFFVLMNKVYRIEPSAEHYSCMVEVLGCAGLFIEAEHFINSAIPVESSTQVWRALLASSQAHGNMKAVKLAAEKLIQLEPNDSMANLLLQEVLLASGEWTNSSKIATTTTKTSSSWIEVRENVYEFISDQTVNEKTSAKLAELIVKVEELGYVVEKSNWSQTAEYNEGILHTELMALAYGLVYLPHGTPLRVLKSARMCSYCHHACKIISKFVARDIVIKDSRSFHHFKDGICSCSDHW